MRKYLVAALLACAASLAFALPFAPVSSTSTGTHACTNPTSRVAVASTIAGQAQVELQNSGTVTSFWAWGDVTVTASAASYPVLPGHSKLITLGPAVTHIACFASSGTQAGYHTIGAGDS